MKNCPGHGTFFFHSGSSKKNAHTRLQTKKNFFLRAVFLKHLFSFPPPPPPPLSPSLSLFLSFTHVLLFPMLSKIRGKKQASRPQNWDKSYSLLIGPVSASPAAQQLRVGSADAHLQSDRLQDLLDRLCVKRRHAERVRSSCSVGENPEMQTHRTRRM